MPCTRLFDLQPASYKASVLGSGLPRVAIEAGVTDGWYKYVGLEGAVIGMDRFGESGPGAALFKHFGFTPENVVGVVKTLLGIKLA
jgi:transketolase